MLKPRLAVMRGRDPHEHGRASTPLELLFDLTFAIAQINAWNRLGMAFAVEWNPPKKREASETAPAVTTA